MRFFLFKTLTIIALLVGIAFTANAQSTNVTVVITTNDGVEHVFHLTEDDQLYFEDGENLMVTEGNNGTTTFELANIRKLVCSETTGTTENSTTQLQILPNPTHNSFIIRNLSEASLARIYSIDGRLVKAFQATEGTVVDMSDLAEGLYLLNINGQTLKLMKL